MTLYNDVLQGEHSDLFVVEEDKLASLSTPIPFHQTPGSQLLRLQKQLRDELAKCSAAVFMVDDTAILENVQRKVHSIHSELLSTSSICKKTEELPILKNLMKEEVSEYRRKAEVIARANQLTRRYKKLALPLFCTGTDGKLGRVWECGYKKMCPRNKHHCYICVHCEQLCPTLLT